MMTVNEVIRQTQGKGVGLMNRLSAQYAQTLILPEEEVLAAVVANVSAHGERFPGVVVLTDQRVMAVCGLPGIKRSVIYEIEQLEKCVETPTAIHYKAIFSTKENAFSMTMDPDVGEKFSRYVAILNGEEESFDAAFVHVDSGIFNPTLVRNKIRARQAKRKERARRAAEREAAQSQREAREKARVDALGVGTEGESTLEVAQRLARRLEEARTKGFVDDTDPQAVAARLAAELAAEEARKNDSESL